MEALEDARAAGPTGTGDEWLRVGSIKFFADGSLGGRTAALSEPYADGAPGELIEGEQIRNVFGIERRRGAWELISPTADPRSSP